jgi:hypothetical protein
MPLKIAPIDEVMEEVTAWVRWVRLGPSLRHGPVGKFFRINGQLVKWNEWQPMSGRDLAVSL